MTGNGVTHAVSYRWNDTDGQYNADIGVVYFRNDKLVGTSFSPD